MICSSTVLCGGRGLAETWVRKASISWPLQIDHRSPQAKAGDSFFIICGVFSSSWDRAAILLFFKSLVSWYLRVGVQTTMPTQLFSGLFETDDLSI